VQSVPRKFSSGSILKRAVIIAGLLVGPISPVSAQPVGTLDLAAVSTTNSGLQRVYGSMLRFQAFTMTSTSWSRRSPWMVV
jgi:hypothetical protein